MYVRTSPIDQKQYLVTEDEIAKIEHEWLLHHENQANQPQRTDKEYEHLFNMPLSISVNRTRPQSLIDKLSCKNPVPVRWVLGSCAKLIANALQVTLHVQMSPESMAVWIAYQQFQRGTS